MNRQITLKLIAGGVLGLLLTGVLGAIDQLIIKQLDSGIQATIWATITLVTLLLLAFVALKSNPSPNEADQPIQEYHDSDSVARIWSVMAIATGMIVATSSSAGLVRSILVNKDRLDSAIWGLLALFILLVVWLKLLHFVCSTRPVAITTGQQTVASCVLAVVLVVMTMRIIEHACEMLAVFNVAGRLATGETNNLPVFYLLSAVSLFLSVVTIVDAQKYMSLVAEIVTVRDALRESRSAWRFALNSGLSLVSQICRLRAILIAAIYDLEIDRVDVMLWVAILATTGLVTIHLRWMTPAISSHAAFIEEIVCIRWLHLGITVVYSVVGIILAQASILRSTVPLGSFAELVAFALSFLVILTLLVIAVMLSLRRLPMDLVGQRFATASLIWTTASWSAAEVIWFSQIILAADALDAPQRAMLAALIVSQVLVPLLIVTVSVRFTDNVSFPVTERFTLAVTGSPRQTGVTPFDIAM